jgi:DNA-binding NarL/FixJ family response regulator
LRPFEEAICLKALVADDHALLRTGLIHALSRLEATLTAYEASDADEVMRLVNAHPDLDLILLDLFMPGANGFDLLSRVCVAANRAPVVVLSASDDPDHMRKALDCGAAGFIPKSAAPEVMLSALGLVLAGGIYVPPDLVHAPPPVEAEGSHLDSSSGPLTARQGEVLRLMGQGRSNKQIARDLALSENTVKIHVAGILRALGAANRTEAVMLARDRGFDFGAS